MIGEEETAGVAQQDPAVAALAGAIDNAAATAAAVELAAIAAALDELDAAVRALLAGIGEAGAAAVAAELDAALAALAAGVSAAGAEAVSSAAPDPAPVVEPTLAGVFRRYRQVVVIILMACVAAGGWYVVAGTAQYTATVTVFVQDQRNSPPSGGTQNVQPPEHYVADQVALLKSKRIADRASQLSATGSSPITLSSDYFLDHTTVDSSSSGNNLIDIGFTTSEASTALAGLESVVSAYRAIRGDDAQADAAPIQQQSAGVTEYMPAQVQASSRFRRWLPILVPAVIGGAVIAAVVAYILARRRPIITRAEAAGAVLGVPLLAEVPALGFRRGNTLPMLHSVSSPAAAAFRSLAAAIDLSQNDAAASCIAVISASRGEGRTTVCANLALALAGSDVRAVMVEPERRWSSELMRAAGAGKPIRLETDLGWIRLEQMTLETGPPQQRQLQLALLAPVGSTSARERYDRLMHHDSAPKVFSELSRHFDVVLFDGPALCERSPGLRLLNRTQRVVIVVNGGSSVSALREAARRCARLGVTVVGYVFNHAPSGAQPARLAKAA